MQSAALNPCQALFSPLRERWPAATLQHVVLDVDDPFLTGEHQTLLRDGRIGEICYVLFRGSPDRGLLLHTKRYYPPGGFRLPTGGIRPAEDPVLTLCREVQEETGITVALHATNASPAAACLETFLGLITYQFQHPRHSLPVLFGSFVFVVQAPSTARPEPQDATEEIAGWRWQAPGQLADVAHDLRGLTDPYWHYWGRFRAVVHDFVAQQWTICH